MRLSQVILRCWPFLIYGAWSSSGSCSCEDLSAPERSLTVTTLTGRYTGLQNKEYVRVREFRNIPYAEPPVGKLRWLPPVPVRPSKKHSYSYRFPPSCPQYLMQKPSLWNSNITDFIISTDGQSHRAGDMAQTSAEDCLRLAVWTPVDSQPGDKLPVALFIPGGSFRGGGIDIPYQMPTPWVNRTQNHIVVSINYRVNVFGFPNAAGLDFQNVGMLDQRAALEWTYSNIAAFGGDPDRIVLWGHSAGGVSADVLNYAYPDDPLVSGFFLQSGAAIREFAQGDDALQTNFTFMAKELGCDFAEDPEAEVECMRDVPVNLITKFVGKHADNDAEPQLFFRPVVDDRLIFANYTERAQAGLLSNLPALISDTSNEEASLIAYPVSDLLAGPNKTEMDRGTLKNFVCVSSNSSSERAKNNLVTYRYQYVGNYTNLTPLWWMGAYHGSDIPMIFGTYNQNGGAAEEQARMSKTMQDYVGAFLADPTNGLRRVGWLPHGGHDGDGASTVRFGGVDGVRNISSSDVDDACLGTVTYDSSPR